MRVVELALKQINEHTDITATYEQHKKRADNHRVFIQVQAEEENRARNAKNSDSSPRIENLVKSLPTS